VQIRLFGLGTRGKSPAVSSQRHLNLYAEMTPDSDKGAYAFYGTPGLELFAALGESPIRGGISVGDAAFFVHRGIFWELNNAGVRTNRGTIGTTSGRVSMAYNGTQIAIADGSAMYCYTIATHAFATVTSNLFDNPVDVTYQDGYGVACFRDSQRYQISALGDFTVWNALDFASAESNPDGLLRVISDHGELVLAGDQTVEFAGNTGGQDFPFSSFKSSTLQFGLAAPWSLVQYNDSLAGLFKNRMGQVQVMVMRGHAVAPISSQEVDHLINDYEAVADATAFSYMLGGHPMYQINFPTAGKSWLYDASTQLWSPLEYGLNGARHRAEIQVDLLNRTYVTDHENGNIYRLTASAYTDNGAPIARELVGRHLSRDFKPVAVSRLEVDMESGVGLVAGQGANPRAALSVSKDNGRTWGNDIVASMGAIGEYATRIVWRRLGSSRDWLFKIRITDPAKVAITGASIEASQ
jgi:hypothetical protein